MFLKRSKMFPLLLAVLCACSLTTARFLQMQTDRIEESGIVQGTTTAFLPDGYHEEDKTMQPEDGESMSKSALEMAALLQQYSLYRIILYVITAVGLIFLVLFFSKKSAFWGPELAFLGCVSFGCAAVYGVRRLQETIGLFFGLRIAFLTILILLFLELTGWTKKKCSLSWSTFRRFGLLVQRRFDRPLLFFYCQVICAVLSVLLISFALIEKMVFFPLAVPGIFCLLSSLVQIGSWLYELSVLTKCVRLMADTDRESAQFTQLEKFDYLHLELFEKELNGLKEMRQQYQLAVERAVADERFKVELISNVSHDLRTPLTAIIGYGELLDKEDGISAEGQEYLAQLNRKAGYMSDLVESLFELTKVSSGVAACTMQEIDLIRLLEQTLGLFDDKLKAAGLTVRRHYCDRHIPIVTDGARMYQVFANLVGNAVKYSVFGSRIHLEVMQNEDQGVIRVRMVNVASYEMDFKTDEIVERFARGDKARSTQGSGIGLAIAQTYTESVGGKFHVEVDSEQFAAVVELPFPKQ